MKRVEDLSEIIMAKVWLLVQPCGKFRPVYVMRINWDYKYRRMELVRDFEGDDKV